MDKGEKACLQKEKKIFIHSLNSLLTSIRLQDYNLASHTTHMMIWEIKKHGNFIYSHKLFAWRLLRYTKGFILEKIKFKKIKNSKTTKKKTD